jgi:hypothetical protein
LSEWKRREPLAPADELKFLEGLLARKISDSNLAAYVRERIRVLEEQLKKAQLKKGQGC